MVRLTLSMPTQFDRGRSWPVDIILLSNSDRAAWEVYLASDAEMGDMSVAIKVLPPVLARNKRSIEALKREAAVSLRLAHRNICRLHNFNSDGEITFLVMEYIDGKTLEEILDDRGTRKLLLEELLPIALGIAAALDHAHTQNPPILHRDIKPSNIMVTGDRIAKLLDFGIARELKDSMTRLTGKETAGTLLYMSPEQFSGGQPSRAGDIYALGATIFECLSGQPPFHRGGIGHQLLNTQPPELPGQPTHINTTLQAALAKLPDARPVSAGAFAAMLADERQTPAASIPVDAAEMGGLSTVACTLVEPGVSKPTLLNDQSTGDAPRRRLRYYISIAMRILLAVAVGIGIGIGVSAYRQPAPGLAPKEVMTREIGKFYMVVQILPGRGEAAMAEAKRIARFCNDNNEPAEVKLLNNNFIVWSATPFDAKSGENVIKHALKLHNELGPKYAAKYGSSYRFAQPQRNGLLAPLMYQYTKPKRR